MIEKTTLHKALSKGLFGLKPHIIKHSRLYVRCKIMDKRENPTKEKIKLPKNLQKEMMKFFLKTSIPKIAADKERQQEPPILKENWSGEND